MAALSFEQDLVRQLSKIVDDSCQWPRRANQQRIELYDVRPDFSQQEDVCSPIEDVNDKEDGRGEKRINLSDQISLSA